MSCYTCNGSNKANCISCDNITFFSAEYFENRCLKISEIPENYYLTENSFYKRCDISCKNCTKDGNDNCISCNKLGKYYPLVDDKSSCFHENNVPQYYYLDKENKIMNKCYNNCLSCLEGFNYRTGEMNCLSCIEGTYFQNLSSTNCIQKPETGFYVSNGILFPCYEYCLTCIKGGDDDINQCLSCIDDYYLEDGNTTNCLNDNMCYEGCARCYNSTSNPPDIICTKCSKRMEYYPLEKVSNDQDKVDCYMYNSSLDYFYFNEREQMFKLCYKSCKKCSQQGDSSHNNCDSCEENYIMIEEEPNNCYQKCPFYYYYNEFNQYKCTSSEECPIEYPFLILNKKKCVNNCYNDNIYNMSFRYECFQECPEGTYDDTYLIDNEKTTECKINNSYVESECIIIPKR